MRLACEWKYLPCLKARELKSAIVLSEPARCSGSKEEVCLVRWRRERNRSRRAAGMEVDVLPLCIQLIADVLSANRPT